MAGHQIVFGKRSAPIGHVHEPDSGRRAGNRVVSGDLRASLGFTEPIHEAGGADGGHVGHSSRAVGTLL